jgi:hypothetical protein
MMETMMVLRVLPAREVPVFLHKQRLKLKWWPDRTLSKSVDSEQ